MDSQTIEQLAAELGIPLPAHVAQARETLNRLAEIDVPLSPEQPRHHLAAQVRAAASRDEAITGDDIVAMVGANRAGGHHTEAAQVLQQALEDQETLLYQALQRSPRELVPAVAKRIEAVYSEVRKLPSGPTSAADAVHGDAAAIAGFRALETLASFHSKLRTLHRALIADDTDATALAWFADTRCRPAIAASGRNYMPAGPADRISRLRWLSTVEAQAWTPTAKECTDFYFETLRAMQQPKPPPTPAPSMVRA